MLRPLILGLLLLSPLTGAAEEEEEEKIAKDKDKDNDNDRLPTKCEVCKFLTVELQSALDKTRRSKEVLEIGAVLDNGKRKRKIMYNTSEMRLAEAMDNICERILQYNVHAERPGSLRYAKGTSETMATLKNLVHKGVKVELGIPFEMWDEPSAEVSDLKKQCENMLEHYEDIVEDWYFHHQDLELERFLCVSHVLTVEQRDCLGEVWSGRKGDKAVSGGKERKRADPPVQGGATHHHDGGEL
ncbi:protein canopy 4 [Leucoraja erinacea]|uniref:protein canopy 4 n=1 Tax=Leucoraja erinaceus TaxID=7782 RepID=UPI0024572C07|nr:protein canopy 4 [Leucoraja erinacea]